MKHLTTSTALLTILAAAPMAAHADISRTDQSVRLLFEGTGETGSYAELSFADVSPEANTSTLTLDDPLEDYNTVSLGYLYRLNGTLSLGVILDQPYGAQTRYQSGLPFFGGFADIESTALTVLGNYQIDNQISVHGGIRALNVEGTIFSRNDRKMF